MQTTTPNHTKHQFIDLESGSRLPSLRGLIVVDRQHNGMTRTIPVNCQREFYRFEGCYSLVNG